MVWIHGGAYVAGGGEEAWCGAFRLADEGDMVTITLTYRLGVLRVSSHA
jgi:para-nitrobenzyl esterase